MNESEVNIPKFVFGKNHKGDANTDKVKNV